MKIINAVLVLLGLIAGFGGFIAVLEDVYFLSCILVITEIFMEIFRKSFVKDAFKFVDNFSFFGNIIWFIGIVSILLWKIFFNEYGLPGIGVTLIFILAGLTWASKNLINEQQKTNFKGLHLLAAAGIVLSTLILLLRIENDYLKFSKLLAVLVLWVSYLMVVNIEYFNFVRFKIGKVRILPLFIAGVILIAGLVLYPVYILLFIFIIYTASGIGKVFMAKWKKTDKIMMII